MRAEASLLQAVAAGDYDAFARLYDAQSGLVYAFCLRLLGDAAAAEDAAQEVFLKIWRHSARFDSERGSLRSWILAIAHRDCLDRLRARRPAASVDPADLGWVADPGAAPEEEALRSEDARVVRRALATLAPDQRRALTLMYYGGYSQSEIAGALGVPLGTVKSRARLGLQALRRTLGAGGVGGRDGAQP